MRYLLAGIAIAWMTGCSGSQPSAKAPPSTPKEPELFHVDPQTAATVTGTITFTGKHPPRTRVNIDEDEHCVKLNKSGIYDEPVFLNKNGTLSQVFVYVKRGLEGKHFERPSEPVILEQRNCQFSPRVFAIRAGQPLQVTNADPVTHNVHPVAKMNREWNQSQEPGAPPLERKFARPEVMIRVKCNVHSWMRSWVAVMDHPYFAVTGPNGSFEIPNLPPGDYTIEAWQEKLGVMEQKIHLDAAGQASISFAFQGVY